MIRHVITLTAAAATLTACATSPENIAASSVSPMRYQSYTCDQLAHESAFVGDRLATLTGQQQRAHDNDAALTGVGVVLFWPALFFLNGDDNAAALADLKGQSDAIEQSARLHGCTVQTIRS